MDETELLFPLEDEMETVKADVTNEINAANKQLADEIKMQKTIINDKCRSVDEQAKRNAAELAELNRRLDKNWEDILKLQEMMAQNDKGIEEVKAILAKNSQMLRDKANSH